jgi:methylenetetrahydrofolate--tRNA-(uracil-5-)-methyltransferase
VLQDLCQPKHDKIPRMADLIVVGGGLAGCEAAWQAAQDGLQVDLFEMRPFRQTGAHTSDGLAELVCSNSLGSALVDRASGLLKEELRLLGSLLLKCAEKTVLPAGGALAVDREAFSDLVTQEISHHPLIHLIRAEVTHIPVGPCVIASGPLTSPALAQSIQSLTGEKSLYFYDAIAPIVRAETINMEIAYRASRYGASVQQEGDYINCPLNTDEYARFVESLLGAERIVLRDFESQIDQGVTAGDSTFFEGCLPVEVIAARGKESLAYGPMRPVGLRDPRTGRWPHAVVQLRQDNIAGTLYNLVGFQTNLTFLEQKRVLRLIPGLENAEFIRYGQMHRNTFIAAPLLLHPTLQARPRDNLFFAGQITGGEGYMTNIATGLLAGKNAARIAHSLPLLTLPETTMLGALCQYITTARLQDFQPMKANYGLLPALQMPSDNKRARMMQYSQRALDDLQAWAERINLPLFTKDTGHAA